MFYITTNDNNVRTSFDTLDNALDAITVIVDDLIADNVIRLYHDDVIIGQYRGQLERVGVDYPSDDYGPSL